MITKYNIFKESLIPYSDFDKAKFKDYSNITYNDIKFDDSDNDGSDYISLKIFINGKYEPGIVFDIEIKNDELYQIHININKVLRGQKLATKLYTKFLYEFGLIYSNISNRTNNIEIPKIHDKLSQDPKIYTFETNIKGGKIFLFKEHPNFEYYVNKYKKREA